MTYRQTIGNIGEDIAFEYLKSKKYKILERNYLRKWGEIDLITIAPDKTLVFIEVKTLSPGELTPEMQLTSTKLRKLQKICYLYANAHEDLIDEDRGWQIDLIAIDLYENNLTKCNKDCDIRHYKNI